MATATAASKGTIAQERGLDSPDTKTNVVQPEGIPLSEAHLRSNAIGRQREEIISDACASLELQLADAYVCMCHGAGDLD
ncbi:unannotated protein [freshwater metagenome]|uniref:Unannotated protein n=1 Tax=freshwater metagenome TaxID=449393 RepID=A0A6J7ITB4_9ZZZZ